MMASGPRNSGMTKTGTRRQISEPLPGCGPQQDAGKQVRLSKVGCYSGERIGANDGASSMSQCKPRVVVVDGTRRANRRDETAMHPDATHGAARGHARPEMRQELPHAPRSGVAKEASTW